MSGKWKLDPVVTMFMYLLAFAVLILASMPAHCQHMKTWAAANVALAVADYETAYHVTHMPQPCFETNTMFGSKYPSRTDYYLYGLGYDAGVETGSWLLYKFVLHKHEHHKVEHLWMLPFGVITYSHVKGLESNLTCK